MQDSPFSGRGGPTIEALETAVGNADSLSTLAAESPADGSATDTASTDFDSARDNSSSVSHSTICSAGYWSRSGGGCNARQTEPSGQQARLVDRVARAFQAAQGRGGRVQLRLNPPGARRASDSSWRVQGTALMAKLEAETSAAAPRSVLLENLPMLRETTLGAGRSGRAV